MKQVARRAWLIVVLLIGAISLFSGQALAHPGSGIVVDRQGTVYFVDTGSGVYRIERDGKLTKLSVPAYHWMTIDVDGKLRNATLPHFSSGDATVSRASDAPDIFVSSDFPITVGHDGALYYPWLGPGEQLKIFRLQPSGTTTVFKALPASSGLRWLNGIVAAVDGSIYFTENKAIRKITPNGELTTVVDHVALSGCDPVPGVETDERPYLRGLDVDAQGTVYVAATGCSAVLKIAPDKKMTTVLRASPPWSPTGVAIFDNDVYVLEYLHTPGDNRREWLPRVRKVTPDGQAVIIAAIER
jgi:streptogramin lyase